MASPTQAPSPSRSQVLRAGMRWSRRRWLRLMFGLLAASALEGFGIEPRWLRTRRLRIGSAPGVRFAYFTDLHYKGDPRLLNAVVNRINDAADRIQFAVFGGDLVEEAAHLPAALEALARIQVPLFGVPGNHDYWAELDFDRIDAAFRRGGGRWLLDEVVDVAGGKVRLAGHTCTHEAQLPMRVGARNVGLVHYPIWADRLAPGWDLMLAGHSHGGQVRIPLLGAVITPMDVGRYELGRFSTPSGPLYVSSGVGTFFLNVRFLCPPELVWVEV